MKKITLSLFSMLIVLITANLAFSQCPIPTGLTATSLSATSAQLNWTAMGGASSYNVEIQNGQNNPTPFSLKPNTNANAYTITGLTGGLVYKFKVRTRCGGDKSNWSAWFTFVAGGGAVNCVQLTGLNVTSTTTTGASFNWNASVGGLGYAVRVEDASGNPVNFLFNINTTTNSYTISGLNPSSNYKVKVRKRCAVGVNASWTPWVFFTTNALRIGDLSTQSIGGEVISIYPNPASDFVQINISGNENERIESFEIYDITGRLVKSESISAKSQNSTINIPLTDIKNGIYQIRIETSERNSTRKIVVKK
ncbi:MAG: fibronectin type III domain-containing protein [Bacteroidetes bacterium]|nr:fibronectin type III domain-containing protein [Bacteroidota bacterium]